MDHPILQTYNRANISFIRGSGSWLETSEGDQYLDMGSGIAVNSFGHADKDLVNALISQAKKLWHTSNLYEIPSQTALAEKLVENTFADKVFFTNSGTESIECAVKIARKYQFSKGNSKKNKIVTFEGAFHGRSMAAISASNSEKLTNGYGPLLPGFETVPLNDFESLEKLEYQSICAVLIEPIQGEGGVREVSKTFLKKLREICNEYDSLLIFDEVQSGIGRTGLFFAYERSGVSPDIVAVAKGIGGGFPLGVCLSTNKASKPMTSGTHGSTFGGNPLACSVGIAVLEKILSKGFLNSVVEKGSYLKQQLSNLASEFPLVFESVRGEGLMLGVKCAIKNLDVVEKSYENRLLVVPGGDNIIRVLPSLNVSYAELDEAIARLKKSAIQLIGEK